MSVQGVIDILCSSMLYYTRLRSVLARSPFRSLARSLARSRRRSLARPFVPLFAPSLAHSLASRSPLGCFLARRSLTFFLTRSQRPLGCAADVWEMRVRWPFGFARRPLGSEGAERFEGRPRSPAGSGGQRSPVSLNCFVNRRRLFNGNVRYSILLRRK